MFILEVEEYQEDFVASTMFSLTEAKIFNENKPLAIYNEDIMIGFLMYSCEPESREYWLNRLLIDKKYQKQGYGTQSINKFINLIKEKYQSKSILLSFEPDNKIAEKVYLKLGFKYTGKIIDDETVLMYECKY